MKQINVYFEDDEFAQLEIQKAELSWHDFIMSINKQEETK